MSARAILMFRIGLATFGALVSLEAQATIALRAAVGSNNGAGGTSITMNVPTGVVNNDVMVMSITVVGGTSTSITTPTGWTLLDKSNSTTALTQAIYWRLASGEPASYSVTITSAKASGTIIALSGANHSALAAARYAGQADASSTTFSSAALGTWTSANGMRLIFGGLAYGSSINTVPTGFTNNAVASSTGGNASTRTTSTVMSEYVTSVTTEAALSQTTFWANAAVQVDHQVFIIENEPPTTAQNTANATAFGSNTTPTLQFTGTDPESDAVRYETQIDTLNTFNSVTSTSPVVDSEMNSYQGGFGTIYSTAFTAYGESFTSNGGVLTTAQFYMSKTGSPTGNGVAKIYAETHTSGFGTDSVPSGAALATSDNFDVSTLGTSMAWVTFTFSTPYTLVSGTNYVITFEYAGGDSSDFIAISYSSNESPGNLSSVFSGTWSPSSSDDLEYYVYVDAMGPLLDEVSGTNAGFADVTNSGDTDPFPSGDTCSFTVQAANALSSGTYYWRVRAIDPNGSNTYGAWSATENFTISTSTARVKHRIINYP